MLTNMNGGLRGVSFEVFPVSCADEPSAHGLRLHIHPQQFQVGGGPGMESREQAEWMAIQLEAGLRRVFIANIPSVSELEGMLWRDDLTTQQIESLAHDLHNSLTVWKEK